MEKLDNRGITLIALIITIIVMIILVGVTINIALNGGLFTATEKAAKDTQIEVDKEILMSSAIGALGQNGKVDFTKLDQNLPEGFTGSNGMYTNGKNTYKVDKYGNVELVEPEAEKIISADDPEASYWKTDGQGTILYYEVPEGVEVPETLVVPCKIGDEKITKIESWAFCSVRVEREDNGTIILNDDGSPSVLDEIDEYGNPIPTGQITKVRNIIISKGIEEINENAILFCTSLKEVTIPSTLKTVGGTIIAACELDTLKISEGATEIFDEEFMAVQVKNVILPSSVTRIGDRAFSQSNLSATEQPLLTTINIPQAVTYIGKDAFNNCRALTSISLPEGLITIGERAFWRCTSIKEITIPSTVDNLGCLAFFNWNNDQTIYVKGKTEPPATTDNYSGVGWEGGWHNTNANIVWDK